MTVRSASARSSASATPSNSGMFLRSGIGAPDDRRARGDATSANLHCPPHNAVMGCARTIAAALAVAAGCASVPPPGERLPAEVGAFLERRGLGPDALGVIGNLVRHGPPAPRAAPALVVELLGRPLDALDAAEIF